MVIPRPTHVDLLRGLLSWNSVVALLGARQTGKTTLARAVAARTGARTHVFDLERAQDVARLADPELALGPLRGLIVLDEIQRRPELFPMLRVLADRPRRPARFLVLGNLHDLDATRAIEERGHLRRAVSHSSRRNVETWLSPLARLTVGTETSISYNGDVRFLLISVLVVSTLGAQSLPAPPSPTVAEQPPAAAYVCPMHPDVMSAIPGKCPRCGMELVAAPASAYVCPMHPDVMSATPGTCSRCNMTLVAGSPLSMPDFRLHMETMPKVLRAGQPTKFRFTVRHPLTGAQAHKFATLHDKLFHLFVISRDMNEFAHIHPEQHADGSFTIEHTLPKPGHYTLFSDFLAIGGGAQIVATPIVTAGVEPDIMASQAHLTPDMPWIRTADGAKVHMLNEQSAFLGGEEIDLEFRFTDSTTDAPLTDLERYLGAWGHLLILSEDMTEYVHAHPREETQPDPNAAPSGGPEIIFDALLPKPGQYRAWLQFQRDGRLSTVSFTFAAPRPGESLRLTGTSAIGLEPQSLNPIAQSPIHSRPGPTTEE